MRFIDEAIIIVQSGNGGRGCVSFRRERFIPRGGPDGGDGGKGGDIILRTNSSKRTLYHLQYQKHFKAANGGHGQGNKKNGRQGQDLIIELPAGTLVLDAETESPLYDLTLPDQQVIVAQGGRGGKGNHHFKSSTHRAPRFAQPGESGLSLKLKLVLKLMADVGIIGLPNAGKSTLISALSSARPKIAGYPFTTLTPTLGVVKLGDSEPIVMADIPGLIEGAHQGAGMGIQFLRHIERTRILVHLVDVSTIDPELPLQSFQTVNVELAKYSPGLAEKPQLVVLNKMDIDGADQLADRFQRALPDSMAVCISAAGRNGLEDLMTRIRQLLDSLNESR